jgi:hypothetical protein
MFNWFKKIFGTVEKVAAGTVGHVAEAPYKIEAPTSAVATPAPVRSAPNKAYTKRASTGKKPVVSAPSTSKNTPAKKNNKPKSV